MMLAMLFTISCAASADEVDDLTEMSLESLMEVEVTSAARKEQKLSETAAAIHVISREDIRRSGATSLAEALRLAPGVQVARVNSDAWAISVRGFNNIVSNKLLVMIDGRSIYNPVFSGVHWGQQDVVLADIDRIEVVRGPGGALWGANAVNGVINIITRPAAETQGGLAEAGGGDPLGGFGTLRYGGELGESAHYRAYGKHTERGELETASGGDADDDSDQSQIGGRIDWQPTQFDQITLQGDAYTGDFGQPLFLPSLTPPGMFNVNDTGDKHGHNVLLNWRRSLAAGTHFELQTYYDHYTRDSRISREEVSTWDLDFHYDTAINERLSMLWGLGYRRQDIELEDRFTVQFDELSPSLDTFSSFIQGDIDLTQKLRLTLGSKFEHNDFTGFEVQPNARLLWQATEQHSVWAAVSRAVRTPNLIEDGALNNSFVLAPPVGLPLLFQGVGNSAVEAEELVAYELGWRGQPHRDVHLDVAVFYNDYDNLLSSEFNPVPEFRLNPVPHLLFQSITDNQLRGKTYGLEASTEWQATETWRLTASYSLLEMDLEARPGSADLFSAAATENSNPEQQFQIRSYVDLPHNLEFDTSIYWVDELPGLDIAGVPSSRIDDYLRLDLHLGWRPAPGLQIGLFAQNILDDRHPETNQFIFSPTEVPRAVFARARLTW